MWNPGALVPVPEIHGNAKEVTADNVPDKDVIFSPDDLAKLEAACGPPQVRQGLRKRRRRPPCRARLPCPNESSFDWRAPRRTQALEALKMERPPHGMLVDNRRRRP